MQLKWGQTPWDRYTRDELLRETQRMYAAITEMASCLKLYRAMTPTSPYWDLAKRGTGGKALEMARQITEPLERRDPDGDMDRMFFRYAVDLLFEGDLGHGWSVCPKCGTFWGAHGDRVRHDGERCGDQIGDCDGILRPLTWDDLQPS